MKVAYLGPEGSYTHASACEIFEDSKNAELVACNSAREIIDKLGDGEVDQAVLAIENSIEGGVNETIDNLAQKDNIYIIGEYILPIQHCLLAKEETDLSELTEISAHSMSFGQCRDFLLNNCPEARLVNKSSNSAAAQELAGSNTTSSASIGSSKCAELYGLKVLAEAINDEKNNETRFWLLDKKPLARKEGVDYKTSIIFRTIDEPGSLVKVLEPIAKAGINLSRIESRPAKKGLGEYVFYLDLGLHKEDDKFNKVYKEIQMYFSFYKWLGSYTLIS